jgi:predicted DNA-binding ArsR family transcriptional regulator
MKYIITESQYNLILESKKYIQLFQEIIDTKLKYIRKVCEMGAEDFEGDVGDESCRQIEDISKIEVTDADWVTIKHSNRPQEEKYMHVKIMVYYSSIRQYGNFDADDLSYDLEQMIRKSTGMPFILNYDTTNTNKNFNW